MLMLVLLFVFVCFKSSELNLLIEENSDDISFQIVGIFETHASSQLLAFNETVSNVQVNDWRLQPMLLHPERTDSYSVWKKLCSDETVRPIAIFGPQNPVSDGAVKEQCAKSNIPHIQATWQPLDPDIDNEASEKEDKQNEDPETGELMFKKISINFYPDTDEISRAYTKLLQYYKWQGFTALYEDDHGLSRVQKILALHTDHYPVIVRKLNPSGSNYKIFKELKKFQESRVLLDCHINNVKKYMEDATALNMTNPYQHYILMTMDAATIVDDYLIHLQSNTTWLSLINIEQLNDTQHFLAPRVHRWSEKANSGPPKVIQFETESLIMDDIAKHVLRALQSVHDASGIDREMLKPREFMCSSGGSDMQWRFGAMLQNEILKTKSLGVTGDIEFDENGHRANYTLNINEVYVNELRNIGQWDSREDEIVLDEKQIEQANQPQSKHFVIISRKAKPYFFDKAPCTKEECSEEEMEPYEGYSVDLVKAIFKILNEKYNYTYEFRPENYEYGTYDPVTKKWSGLIGELLDKTADLAVCDLTITEERKKVIDFSQPIMTLGISILFKKERKVSPGMFSFLNPYSVEVWLYTATAYLVVSIALFICSRLSPADWENPQPCDPDPEELENIWTFKNCAWLTMGSLMTQGCDILPKAIGSRWVCGMWWFFVMIVVQTYIAQLAASMTSALEDEPVNSIEDLAKHTKILYGAVEGGSTYQFFKKSKDKLYKKIYENMVSNSAVFAKTNDEGEKRVLNSRNKYAFFMESSTIEYKLKRECQLKKVGENLDSKDYGIGMPANSPYRSQINEALLKLQLSDIKKKWWEDSYGAMPCEDKKDDEDVEGDLEMENMIGAFIVLIGGLLLAVLITMAEFMNEVRNIVVREQVTHKEAFIKELRASLNLFQLQKPVLRNPSRAPSVANSLDNDEHISRSATRENLLEIMKQL